MGLDIELQDERGESLECVGDPGNLLLRLLPVDADGYPMLASMDPYDDECALAGIIESMAARCRDEVHLYLKFIGD